MSILRIADGNAGVLLRLCATDGWKRGATVLKHDERSTVLTGESSAGPVVVKSLLLDRPKDVLSRMFSVTRFVRQWGGAELLARHGFAVATPLALWRGRDEQGRLVESLAMERLSGKTVLRHLADRDLPRDEQFALARELGSQAARLALAGLVNRDHKPSNLIVKSLAGVSGSVGASGSVVAILDTVAIRRARPRAALVHMLFELIVEPIGCRLEIPLGLRLAAVRSAVREAGWPRKEVTQLWRDVRAALLAHGDPTPRINPLADRSIK
jgi:hypothetical protein